MESAEHKFLSDAALEIMKTTSQSGLFAYKEGSRKLFDFSCDLARDWSKMVSGQTLWNHNRDGIDKDIRTFLTDSETSICVYIAKHTTANMTRVGEVVGSYRNTAMNDQLPRLRVFWVAGDFDADDENARAVTYASLREEMTRDLLLHVVLEGLTEADLTRFATSLRPGTPLTILSYIKSHGFKNLRHTSANLGITSGILKEEILRLFIIGALESDHLTGGVYQVSDKGNAMLDVCSRLRDYIFCQAEPNREFMYVAQLLGMDFSSVHVDARNPFDADTNTLLRFDAESPTIFLMNHVYAAEMEGIMEWPDPHFALPSN